MSLQDAKEYSKKHITYWKMYVLRVKGDNQLEKQSNLKLLTGENWSE